MPLETFGQEKVEKPVFTEKKKTKFLDLSSTATVRILSQDRLVVDTHYVNKTTVQCLGEDCPICANNKNLIMQFPESFRDEPHYSPRRQVKMVNVLDKTLVRICSSCDTEVRSGMTCPKCNTIITSEPVQSNTIKVLSKGVTLFDSLDAINNGIMDAKGERVGITNYDVTLAVSGTGKNRITTPIAGQVTGPVAYNAEDLFDLETVTVKLTPSEMLDLQRGVGLRDIFAARKSSAIKNADTDPFVSKEVLDAVQSDVDALFGNINS